MARLTLLLSVLTALVALLGGFRYVVDTLREYRWRKRTTGKWLAVLALCLVPSVSYAAIINAASCSNADVQTAINSAANSDTVQIPSGACTWTSQVTISNTKGIILRGSGIDVTTITNGAGVEVAVDITTASTNALTRVTNFTWDANQTSNPGINAQFAFGGVGANTFRFDHMKIKNLTGRGVFVMANSTGNVIFSGLIDHNTIECPTNHTCHGVDIYGGGDAQAEGNFARPIALGTDQMTYIEDNIFNYGGWNDDAMESTSGARWVYRYNTIINEASGWHGADTGYLRGIHSYEAYRNTFSSTNPTGKYNLNSRSGTGVIFDNSWSGNYAGANLQLYRATAAYPIGTRDLACAGLESWDGNAIAAGSPGEGWPCLDQTGWVFGVGTGNGDNPTFTNVPLYWWSNTNNGSRLDPSPGNVTVQDYIVADRDYVKSGPSFDGTSGVGVGTLASRPATCTGPTTVHGLSVGGVGYWATDQGTWNKIPGGQQGVLYKCTATDTWTLYYTPYEYPHVLQGYSAADNYSPILFISQSWSIVTIATQLMTALGLAWRYREPMLRGTTACWRFVMDLPNPKELVVAYRYKRAVARWLKDAPRMLPSPSGTTIQQVDKQFAHKTVNLWQ